MSLYTNWATARLVLEHPGQPCLPKIWSLMNSTIHIIVYKAVSSEFWPSRKGPKHTQLFLGMAHSDIIREQTSRVAAKSFGCSNSFRRS